MARDPDDPFKAKFAGRCCKCKNQFPQGALIRKWGGKFAHAGCSKGVKAPVTPTARLPQPAIKPALKTSDLNKIVVRRKKPPVITDENGNYPTSYYSQH